MIRAVEVDWYRICFSGFHRGETWLAKRGDTTKLVFVSPTYCIPHILRWWDKTDIGCTCHINSDRIPLGAVVPLLCMCARHPDSQCNFVYVGYNASYYYLCFSSNCWCRPPMIPVWQRRACMLRHQVFMATSSKNKGHFKRWVFSKHNINYIVRFVRFGENG